MVDVGSKAPDFNLKNQNKEDISLAGLKGKKVVIAFYPAAFTGVCQKELCTFRDNLATLNGLDATVLGIAVDPPFAAKAFAEQHKLGFSLLSDYRREAVRAYGVTHDDFAGLPGYTAAKRSVFVTDREGVVRYAWVAPTPAVEPDYEAVKKALADIA